MNTNEPLHLALSVVGDYLPHAAAMVASVVANGQERDLHLHLLHDGRLPAADLEAFEAMVVRLGVTFRGYVIEDDRLQGLPTVGFATWYRVFLPELLPQVDRVLYLDADLLVLASLRPLRAIELGSSYVAAVTNVFESGKAGHTAGLGLAGPDAYFNAGVLLMNLALIRVDSSTDAVLAFAPANVELLPWRDQDALNVVLGHGRVELPPRWNCMNSILEFDDAVRVFGAAAVEEARRSPAIRHFEGPSINKPWHRLADPAMQRLYRGYRLETPWPRIEWEDTTFATSVLRLMPSAWRRPMYLRLLRIRARFGLRRGARPRARGKSAPAI